MSEPKASEDIWRLVLLGSTALFILSLVGLFVGTQTGSSAGNRFLLILAGTSFGFGVIATVFHRNAFIAARVHEGSTTEAAKAAWAEKWDRRGND